MAIAFVVAVGCSSSSSSQTGADTSTGSDTSNASP